MLTSTPVASVQRTGSASSPRVRVSPASGKARDFDAVVLATHSDTALKILGAGATAAEKEVLGAIPYNRCACVLPCSSCVGWERELAPTPCARRAPAPNAL